MKLNELVRELSISELNKLYINYGIMINRNLFTRRWQLIKEVLRG